MNQYSKPITTLSFYWVYILYTNRYTRLCIYLSVYRWIHTDVYIYRSHLGCNYKWVVYELVWPCSICINKIEIVFWRDGRVVDSSGLENRYSSKELSRVRIPLSPFSYWIFFYCTNMLNCSGSAILSRIAESEQKNKNKYKNIN